LRRLPEPIERQRIRNQIDAAMIPEKFNAFLSRVAHKKSASVIVIRPPARAPSS